MNTPQLYEAALVREVTTLRAQGHSDDEIAEQLQQSPQVIKAVPLPKPNPQHEKTVQHLQLKKMAQMFMPQAKSGDKGSAALMLKIQQRHSALLGLDAPMETVNYNHQAEGDLEIRKMSTDQLKRLIMDNEEANFLAARDITPEVEPTPTDQD